jgi:hypothetical protein
MLVELVAELADKELSNAADLDASEGDSVREKAHR